MANLKDCKNTPTALGENRSAIARRIATISSTRMK